DNDSVKKAKTTSSKKNVEDSYSDDPFISNKVEESTSLKLYSKDSSLSSSSQRILQNLNQDLLKRLREEKLQAKSKM
ncbi:21550_t:CDS:2, partial [Gigaspora margarita]